MSEYAQDHQESKEFTKDTHGEGIVLPESHIEALRFAGVIPRTMSDIGRTVYNSDALFGAGLHREWSRLTAGENSEEAFARAYTKYVDQPGQLQQERPGCFDFLKAHVFFGKEYPSAPQQETDIRFGGTTYKEVPVYDASGQGGIKGYTTVRIDY
jgi:hypothetical protein